MTIRKNQALLTPAEKDSLVRALLVLKNERPSQMGLPGRYDDYVQMHVLSMQTDGKGWAHGGPAFLPWHRAFLRRLELELQEIDASIALPYWDWTLDQIPGVSGSPFTPDFMGSNGQPGDLKVMDGPFAFENGNWTLHVRVNDPVFLTRNFAAVTRTLPTPANVASALAETPYDAAPWMSRSQPGFRDRLEGFHGPGSLHNRVHAWIGGIMNNTSTSPSDPIFFLHHANVDRLWAQWQFSHSDEPYVPSNAEPVSLLGHRLSDPMLPWGAPVTVASTLKYWEGYQYDNVPIPARDPSGFETITSGSLRFAVPNWKSSNLPSPSHHHHHHGPHPHAFALSPEDLNSPGGHDQVH